MRKPFPRHGIPERSLRSFAEEGFRAALLSFTFFKVTEMAGEVTLQGMTSSLPSFMYMISGISLCTSTKGLPVSGWEEKGKTHMHVSSQDIGPGAGEAARPADAAAVWGGAV